MACSSIVPPTIRPKCLDTLLPQRNICHEGTSGDYPRLFLQQLNQLGGVTPKSRHKTPVVRPALTSVGAPRIAAPWRPSSPTGIDLHAPDTPANRAMDPPAPRE